MRLMDKTVVVTASTRGIGLAIVRACAAEGAKVYMAARDLKQAQEEADRLVEGGARVRCVYNDASKPETFVSMVEEVSQKDGRLDVLINNFGTSDPRVDRDIMNTPPEVFERTVNMNLRSVYVASQAAAAVMARQGGGSIINISSVGGSVPDLSQVSYGVSKAAINYLTKLIAVQCARENIRCNAILPGMTATDAVRERLSEEFREKFVRHIPLGRMGLPEEIAAAAVYFASDESAYTTGQTLTISGGFGLGTPLYADFAGAHQR